MNFFQSVFSDDPEPDSPPQSPQNPNPNPNPSIQSITSAWTFSSSLLQTLASKSESVLQTYRHDLQEFTSGLKKETDVILEAGVESLESVGEAVENLGNTVTSILTVNYIDNDHNCNSNDNNTSGHISTPFSRVDALIRTLRGDAKTYLNDPEDLGEFSEWKLGFGVEALKGEIEEVVNADGGVVREIFEEVVPGGVDEVTFWERYFYKVWKVRKVEEARVKLVKRAVSGEDDEELSWDVDEDEYEEKETVGNVVFSEVKNGEKEELEVKPDVKVGLGLGLGLEGKTTDRDSDISIVSTQPSPEEDGWDEIEDIGSSDENKDKGVARGSPDRAELRKRLSVAEDDEDLTWDIEDDGDDDKPVKA